MLLTSDLLAPVPAWVLRLPLASLSDRTLEGPIASKMVTVVVGGSNSGSKSISFWEISDGCDGTAVVRNFVFVLGCGGVINVCGKV